MKRKWLYEIQNLRTKETIMAWEPCKGWKIICKIPIKNLSNGMII